MPDHGSCLGRPWLFCICEQCYKPISVDLVSDEQIVELYREVVTPPSAMKAMTNSGQNPEARFAKRIAVAVIGGTITLVGVAMIVLPGPAIVVIPIGLSILATEFLWARRYLRKARHIVVRLKSKARRAAH